MAPFTEMENKRGRIEFGGKMPVKLELLTGHPSGMVIWLRREVWACNMAL